MVNYKDLGLVNTKEMFAKAIKGGYAIPAFNFNNMEQMQAIIKAAVETKSPVILQVSKGARQYANATLLRYMAQGAVEYAKELGCPNPQIVLHQRGDGTALLILHTEYIEIRRGYFQLVVVLSYRLRGISAQGKERPPRTSV